ncbi:MAG: ATP-binding cassette domain-containing protein, partial [Mariprofundaceae bacterium]|nr:ATP-binding cassette domain-containing protein [Mariprofundaceae bacterium]
MNRIHIMKQLGTLNLHVEARFLNEIIVISGENGAGKSTLLRCLAGLETCHGSLHINGEVWFDTTATLVKPSQHRAIGFVWNDAVLLPWLDVQANITLAATKNDEHWLHHICEALEVCSLLSCQPMMLSTGEAQRVSLARALYNKPSLLLLDEPFSAQAPEIRLRLRTSLQRLQQTLNIP